MEKCSIAGDSGDGDEDQNSRNQGKWNDAEQLEIHVMEMKTRFLGVEHSDTLSSMANLAATYRDQGKWNDAEQLQIHVMEMKTRILGLEHPDPSQIWQVWQLHTAVKGNE
ncbi:hypothetical protein BDQ17DRAFT_1439776 [Cyathus striatus]|nr:hypothetical protein BDQ17DRAFT_1439776 [Cyathus striatus]